MLACYHVLSLDGLKLCKLVSHSDLVPVSFLVLTIPWTFRAASFLVSYYRRASRFVGEFQKQKWRTSLSPLFALKCRC